MKRFAALFALVFAAACGDTATQPAVVTDDLLVTSFAKVEKISICHKDEDTGSYFPKTIPASAWDDHQLHGDGVPGGDVPGMAKYTFDANCGLVAPPVPPIPACLQEAIDDFNTRPWGFPWSFDDYAPWVIYSPTNGVTAVSYGGDDPDIGAQALYSPFPGSETTLCAVAGPMVGGSRSVGSAIVSGDAVADVKAYLQAVLDILTP